MKRKALAAVLSLVMILALVPAMSFAATEVASGYCGGEGDGTNLAWTLDSDGVLTISGKGKMKDYSEKSPWYNYQNVTIPGNVTRIGKCAFYNCKKLTGEITIPASVNSIENSTFFSSCLKDVYFGGSEEQWDEMTIGSHNEPLKKAAIHYFSSADPFTVKQSGVLDDKSGDSVQWDAWSDGAVAVWGNVSETDPVLAATYDEDGRMTGLIWMTRPGRADISGGDTARLFWLDQTNAPKCENAFIGE